MQKQFLAQICTTILLIRTLGKPMLIWNLAQRNSWYQWSWEERIRIDPIVSTRPIKSSTDRRSFATSWAARKAEAGLTKRIARPIRKLVGIQWTNCEGQRLSFKPLTQILSFQWRVVGLIDKLGKNKWQALLGARIWICQTSSAC